MSIIQIWWPIVPQSKGLWVSWKTGMKSSITSYWNIPLILPPSIDIFHKNLLISPLQRYCRSVEASWPKTIVQLSSTKYFPDVTANIPVNGIFESTSKESGPLQFKKLSSKTSFLSICWYSPKALLSGGKGLVNEKDFFLKYNQIRSIRMVNF